MEPSCCRQLMSLDYPRVYLGKKCPILQTSVSTTPRKVEVKKESDFCSLCHDTTGPTTHFIISQPRHEVHVRSLLRIESSVLAFCSVCRLAVTKMVNLMDEVEDIECRIRAVVNQRQQSLTGKDEPRDPASIKDKPTCTRIPIALVCKTETEPGIDIDYEDCIIKSEPWDPFEEVVGSTMPPVCWIEEAAAVVTIPGGDVFPRPRQVSHVATATLPCIQAIKDEDGKTLFICPAPSCGRKCTLKANLFDHMSRIHGLQKSEFQNGNSGRVKKEHCQKSSARRKFCEVCKRGFNRLDLFQAHTHPDKESPSKVFYSCSLCHKLFRTNPGFRYHQNVTHRGRLRRKPFRCYFCSKTSPNAAVHGGHLRIHTLERPFSCGQCGKEFAIQGSLRRHMGTACGSDERKREEIRRRARENIKRHRAKFRVGCRICHKSFQRTEALMVHKRRDHNEFE